MESSSNEPKLVLVLGARSQIGEFLVPALVRSGYRVVAASRAQNSAAPHGVEWVRLTTKPLLPDLGSPIFAVVNLAPIRLLPAMLEDLTRRGMSRLIAFSSTSIFTKLKSQDPQERELVRTLLEAENGIATYAARLGLHWTILRPTLVYSWGRDRNISEIARFVRRFKLFPLIGNGNGLRQPVRAEDLAAACVAALENPATFDKVYNLAGARRLSYRRMVEEVFLHLGMRPRFVTLPGPLIRVCITAARVFPRFRNLSPELATRMQTDMCFDIDEARLDFGFDPRPFALP